MEMVPLHILLAVGLLGLIWGFVFLRKGGVVGGCIATLGTGSCLGHPFFHVSVVTIDRLLLVVVGGMYLVSRNFLGLQAKRITRLDLSCLAFVGFLFYSVFSSDWKSTGGLPVSTLLFFYIMPLTLYWIASRCEINDASFRWIIGFFVGLGVYLAVTALFEVLGLNGAVFPRYIMSPEHEEFLGRGRGPYLNPVGNGMYLSAAFIAAMLWYPYVAPSHRVALVAVGGLICLGAGATLTRSVWLGVIAAFVGMATLIAPKQHRFRVVFAFALAGGVALAVIGGSLTKFKRDKNVSAEDMAQSAKLRPILAAFAWEMFQDRPLRGVGLGQYKKHNLDYLTTRKFDLPMDKAKTYVQHNVFLSLLTETGLLGVGLFVTMLCTWLAAGWRLWYATHLKLWQRQCGALMVLLLAAYLANSMFHELSLIPMLNMLMFFVAGLVRSQIEEADFRGIDPGPQFATA